MATVTYKNQPAIDKTKGNVPLAGTSHIYTVKRVLWPDAIEKFLSGLLIGDSLHVCSGKSKLGNIRVDLYEHDVDIRADAVVLPFADNAHNTVVIRHITENFNGTMTY